MKNYSSGGECCCPTLKHFDNVFSAGGNNIVEVFNSLTTSY